MLLFCRMRELNDPAPLRFQSLSAFTLLDVGRCPELSNFAPLGLAIFCLR
jgi:hypothetical protein